MDKDRIVATMQDLSTGNTYGLRMDEIEDYQELAEKIQHYAPDQELHFVSTDGTLESLTEISFGDNRLHSGEHGEHDQTWKEDTVRITPDFNGNFEVTVDRILTQGPVMSEEMYLESYDDRMHAQLHFDGIAPSELAEKVTDIIDASMKDLDKQYCYDLEQGERAPLDKNIVVESRTMAENGIVDTIDRREITPEQAKEDFPGLADLIDKYPESGMLLTAADGTEQTLTSISFSTQADMGYLSQPSAEWTHQLEVEIAAQSNGLYTLNMDSSIRDENSHEHGNAVHTTVTDLSRTEAMDRALGAAELTRGDFMRGHNALEDERQENALNVLLKKQPELKEMLENIKEDSDIRIIAHATQDERMVQEYDERAEMFDPSYDPKVYSNEADTLVVGIYVDHEEFRALDTYNEISARPDAALICWTTEDQPGVVDSALVCDPGIADNLTRTEYMDFDGFDVDDHFTFSPDEINSVLEDAKEDIIVEAHDVERNQELDREFDDDCR